ncbi:MAG: hypothetical protein WC820_01550 [Spirochaetales bacterium]|jgi:hypothetical protein
MEIHNLAQLTAFVTELATAFWGDDRTRDNGIRSQVRDHEKRLSETEKVACDASSKIDAHLEAHAKMKTATTELKIAIAVAIISSAGSLLMGAAKLIEVAKIVQAVPK